MSTQSSTTTAPIVPLPLMVARLYSVFVEGEYMDFLLTDAHQMSGLVLLITRFFLQYTIISHSKWCSFKLQTLTL
ncbi:hypothetical protein B9Z55_027681 [Caenorhabditis nigoni]|uniref:Uncharacterized protein n=1 Tax=Caenorhabditis nigoni TaxID=1611254 RepID=A0A2G5SFB2_9PELO|nr:hypothetical protein B9Z55_027681 [Caenorhabditis nigoni]